MDEKADIKRTYAFTQDFYDMVLGAAKKGMFTNESEFVRHALRTKCMEILNSDEKWTKQEATQ